MASSLMAGAGKNMWMLACENPFGSYASMLADGVYFRGDLYDYHEPVWKFIFVYI